MSITITGGISFSGGVDIVAPPPSEATAGWYAGGGPAPTISTVQRITFATDTATATVRGPLSGTNYRMVGVENFNYGWICGGLTGSPSSTVDRITYATDTGTASTRGPLGVATGSGAGTGNDTDGWIGGGYPGNMSTVQRIAYATDTAIATTKGPLSSGRAILSSTTDSTSYGWYAGGGLGAPTFARSSTIDRITFSNDTTTASVRGPLSQAIYYLSKGTGNSTYGWFGGGYGPGPVLSTVNRITFATDTDISSVRGPLSSARYTVSGMGNNSYGWFAGGQGPGIPGAKTSLINRITYANDTATAEVRGPLSEARTAGATTSGIQ
jgi:hypothetical protein